MPPLVVLDKHSECIQLILFAALQRCLVIGRQVTGDLHRPVQLALAANAPQRELADQIQAPSIGLD